ncbi:MAG: hypothetical protein ABIS21_03035 [Acidimicrobiales bacterium]
MIVVGHGRRVARTVALLALSLAACGSGTSPDVAGRGNDAPSAAGGTGEQVPDRQPSSRLSDLSSTEQLKAAFNEGSGTPRVVLVLSPT